PRLPRHGRSPALAGARPRLSGRWRSWLKEQTYAASEAHRPAGLFPERGPAEPLPPVVPEVGGKNGTDGGRGLPRAWDPRRAGGVAPGFIPPRPDDSSLFGRCVLRALHVDAKLRRCVRPKQIGEIGLRAESTRPKRATGRVVHLQTRF